MRNENIETTELSDAELDGVAGGVLNGALGQLGSTVQNVAGVDLGGVGTDLGGVGTDLGGLSLGGLNIAPSNGITL